MKELLETDCTCMKLTTLQKDICYEFAINVNVPPALQPIVHSSPKQWLKCRCMSTICQLANSSVCY